MNMQYRGKVMVILKKHGCLNGHEVCRHINNVHDPAMCHITNAPNQGAVHFWSCGKHIFDCEFPYNRVLPTLHQLEKKRWIQSIKMRWTDNRGGNRTTDLFRFFFRDRKDFEKRFGVGLTKWM